MVIIRPLFFFFRKRLVYVKSTLYSIKSSIVPINLFWVSHWPLYSSYATKGNLCFFSSETSHQSHSVTCDYGAASHHSPRSTLEILPCISSPELNPSTSAAANNSSNSSFLTWNWKYKCFYKAREKHKWTLSNGQAR